MLNVAPDNSGGATGYRPRPTVVARNMIKAFGHVTALRGASLEARPGQILAIVGDNGAGKSTLMKILAGVLRPDAGELEVHGERVVWDNPMSARSAGVSAVFQDLALVEPLSVTANMFVGAELTWAPIRAASRNGRSGGSAIKRTENTRALRSSRGGTTLRWPAPGRGNRTCRAPRGVHRDHGRAHCGPRCTRDRSCRRDRRGPSG